jgi:hypothetical protein
MFYNAPSFGFIEKRSFRWRIVFDAPNTSFSEIEMFATKVKKPSHKIDVATKKLNYTYNVNFPKTLTWNPIELSFADFKYTSESNSFIKNNNFIIDNENSGKVYISPQALLYDYLLNNYKLTNNNIQNNIYDSTIQKDTVINSIRIYELDSSGLPIESWIVYNPIITSVENGNLDYSFDQIMSVNLSITYDFAEMKSYDYSEKDSIAIKNAKDDSARTRKLVDNALKDLRPPTAESFLPSSPFDRPRGEAPKTPKL